MEINNIITVVEERADEIANQEITSFSKRNPEVNLNDDAKSAVKIRSLSQLTLQISKFHFKEGEDLKEQFDKWFSENEEEDLRKACIHCLEEESKKIREEANGKLSSLDSYLKKHLGDVHQLD